MWYIKEICSIPGALTTKNEVIGPFKDRETALKEAKRLAEEGEKQYILVDFDGSLDDSEV